MSRNSLSAPDGVSVRVSTLASALALALAGGNAHALGLGGLRVQSALNQPFVGEIDLLDVKPDELDTVKAGIATPGEFSKAGAERYHYLTKLRFSPQISPRGDTVIRVSSREPIREPFMDFLVQVAWPKGTLVKEYTVLLDPPVSTARAAPRVEQPVARSRPERSAAPAPSAPVTRPQQSKPSPQPPATAPTPRPSVPAGSFPKQIGPVSPGAGLWRLAVKNTPPGATVAQTAMALYRNNQGAFIRGDINRLIVGKTLTIPNSAELFALGPDAAQREFEAALRGEKVRREPIADTSTPEPVGEVDQSRLKIAGTAPMPPGPGVLGAGSTAGSEGMEQELLLVREASESTRQETVELRDRIRELEEQLGEIQKLLQLRNAELARIQGSTDGASTPGLGEETIPLDLAPLPPGLEEALAASGGLVPSGPDTESDLQPEKERDSEVAPQSLESELLELPEAELLESVDEAGAPVISAPTQAQPILGQPSTAAAKSPVHIEEASSKSGAAVEDQVTEPSQDASTWHQLLLPLAGMAGVIALGVGALAWVRHRRRREDEDALEGFDEADLSPEHASAEADSTEAQGAGIVSGAGPDEPEGMGSPSSAFSSLGRGDPETDEADVISEADIYIAYGRYREAEELLREEVSRAPDRFDLKFKLAEAYFGAKNHDALRRLMDEMQAAGQDQLNPDQWQRLEDMVSEKEPDSRPDSGLRAASGPSVVARADAIRPMRQSGDSDDALSLDIGNVGRSSGDLGGETVFEDSDSLALEPPSVIPPTRPISQILDDDGPLLLDDDAFTRSLALDPQPGGFGSDAHSDGLALDSPSDQASQPNDGAFSGGASDLQLNIDDLAEATGVDLESFAEPTRTTSRLADDLTLPRSEQPPSSWRSSSQPPSSREAGLSLGGSGLPELDLDREESASSDLLSSQWQMDSGLWDETATKLDLARAYLEMGDKGLARDILEEVMAEGGEEQREEAKALLQGLG